MGTVVPVTSTRGNTTWTVRSDVKAVEVNQDLEPKTVGLKGFDFNKTSVRYGERNNKRRINFFDLLVAVWPGDWRSQLERMNKYIRLMNQVSSRQPRSKTVNLVVGEVILPHIPTTDLGLNLLVLINLLSHESYTWNVSTNLSTMEGICGYGRTRVMLRKKTILYVT